MKLNVAKRPVFTHEGGRAKNVNVEKQLRRSVFSCLLWEREFYEDGVTIADRISELAKAAPAAVVCDLVREARNEFHLRHVPLLLVCALAEAGGRGAAVEEGIAHAIQRADEITELVAIWWRNGRRPLTAAMKRGLAAAFNRFSEYQFAKYDRDGAVRLRDVMFLVHAKPATEEQAGVFKRIAERQLVTPDTWEVALSAGADKAGTFTRLLREGKLGYLALLRNLRNMMEAGVNSVMVRDAIVARKGADRVLPFRYVAAARACPMLEPEIDVALKDAVSALPRLPGRTICLVDISGSMDSPLSRKSDLTRLDAAATLASILNCETLRVFSFTDGICEVPPHRGMAGIDVVVKSQPHGGTYLGGAVKYLNDNVPHDRLIVITDEQTADRVPDPVCEHAYMVNVASAKNGVGYGRWTHIDGFSENVIRFIVESESCL